MGALGNEKGQRANEFLKDVILRKNYVSNLKSIKRYKIYRI